MGRVDLQERKAASARIGIADMWGPVVTDPNDDFYSDCTIASNNTGELLGMYNVLAWTKRQGGQEPLAICFDSMYARNVTSGFWKPKKTRALALSVLKPSPLRTNAGQEASPSSTSRGTLPEGLVLGYRYYAIVRY